MLVPLFCCFRGVSMKYRLLVLLVLFCTAASTAQAAYYQWVDEQGVTNFTDNPDNIPRQYRKKARKLKLQEEPPPVKSAPAPQPPPAAAAPGAQAATPGGHPEQWWREQFTALRGELKALKEGLPEKESKMNELRRKRVLYMRPQDREALNAQLSTISGDEARIAELQQQLDALDLEASKAGVPAGWRQ